LECAFGVVGKILMRGFNKIYLVRFGFRMWEILIFKRLLLLKIQISSKKAGFASKNQLRMW
jgi:hypothetical protein